MNIASSEKDEGRKAARYSPNTALNPYMSGTKAFSDWLEGYNEVLKEDLMENDTQTNEFNLKGCLACGGIVLLAAILFFATLITCVWIIWG